MLYDWSIVSNYITGKWRRISRSEIRNSAAAESEGGAGIHFPHTPFSSRPARAVWSCRAVGAALVSRSAQNRFGFGCIIAPKQIRTPIVVS
jgi:hypothetical protein